MATPSSPLSGQATTQPDDAMLAAVQSRIAQRQAQAPQQQPMAGQAAPTGDPMLAAVQARIAARQGQSQTSQAGQSQGPTISANTNEGFHAEDLSSDPFARAGLKIATPFAKKAMDAIDKLREVQNFTQEGRQEHPIQAHLGDIANKLEGFLFGNQEHPEAAIGTGKYGMLNNPVLAATTGPEAGENVINAARELRGGSEAAGEAPGIIKQVMQGKGVAQEPAQSAIRDATGAEGKMLEGNKTIVDEPIASAKQGAKEAYRKADTEAGFDVKELRAKLKNDEFKLKQLGNTEADQSAAEKLNASIADAKGRLSKVEGTSKDLETADRLHKQSMAGEEFKKALVSATSADGEEVDVDRLLNSLKKMRTVNKRGDRLSQFLGGDEKADELVHKLEAAKDLGQSAVRKQNIAKWVGGIAGLGGVEEVVRHTLP